MNAKKPPRAWSDDRRRVVLLCEAEVYVIEDSDGSVPFNESRFNGLTIEVDGAKVVLWTNLTDYEQLESHFETELKG